MLRNHDEIPHSALASFARPHTIIGTIVSVCSVTTMAWHFGGVLDLCSVAVVSAQTVQTVLASVLMNVAIVGINQLYDKKLDRVNKPYLPLASVAFTSDTALTVVALCTTSSLVLGMMSGSSALLWALVLSLILGIVYSVDYPGLRWKRSPLLAAGCILIVRAFIVQLGFFAHALGTGLLGFQAPFTLMLAMSFITVYAIVIALMKDLPDIAGDKQHDIRTLSVRWGANTMFNVCVALLSIGYVSAAVLSFVYNSTLISQIVGICHCAVLSVLVFSASRVDTSSSASLYSFYMRTWKAFYFEYLLLPFICL